MLQEHLQDISFTCLDSRTPCHAALWTTAASRGPVGKYLSRAPSSCSGREGALRAMEVHIDELIWLRWTSEKCVMFELV